MRTVIVGDPPIEVEQLIKQRQALGQDLFDEVWEGDYHMVPAPSRGHARVEIQLARTLGPSADRAGLLVTGPCNIGERDDFRVPDQAYFQNGTADEVFNPTAEIVVEIVSPADESRMKFDFYHRHGVTEVLIVDPDACTVEWFARDAAAFRPAGGSGLLGVTADELSRSIDWTP